LIRENKISLITKTEGLIKMQKRLLKIYNKLNNYATSLQARYIELGEDSNNKADTNKKVLNVGGNSKEIQLPAEYSEFEQLWLDIDPDVKPDILCDARKLSTLKASQFDAIYCSHNLEHYYRHDVPKVLTGFLHVLKDNGFAHIRVPDIDALMRVTIEKNLDIDDVLYQSPAGPIMVLDVLYGYNVEIERSGQDFFAHKTGFTEKSLVKALQQSGFTKVFHWAGNLEINALAFKNEPDRNSRKLFNLPIEQN
jgi:SAM-dependent methyltransferase